MKITNYLTWVSGITYEKIKNSPTLEEVKDKIHKILLNKTIVGHSLDSDLA